MALTSIVITICQPWFYKLSIVSCQLRVVTWCELVPTDKNQLTTRNLKTK